MNPSLDTPSVLDMLKPQIASIMHYEFSIHNPVFWALVAILFLVLAMIWNIRKSLGFCVLIAAVLLGTTALQKHITAFATKGGEIFDPTIVKLTSLVVLTFITLYYAVIRKDL